MEKIENIIRERVLEGSFFFHNTKFVSFGWTKELYWRMVLGGLEDLYEFFKFNLCCYNIFKIKNILIININLSEIFLKFDQKKNILLKHLVETITQGPSIWRSKTNDVCLWYSNRDDFYQWMSYKINVISVFNAIITFSFQSYSSININIIYITSKILLLL